ncbi:hypothetical protein SAMN05444280_11975 [Tangfeifania diversioriginum]|uniref:Uncharacterized protein n=1 Tax=Tangfeifania diversioriginum TaxID=1168035 RepID=A0A1M6JBI8_9BACT|nr:hypothetical protein SAMN05444280_11975 [Tangfeifania diversioriginum]
MDSLKSEDFFGEVETDSPREITLRVKIFVFIPLGKSCEMMLHTKNFVFYIQFLLPPPPKGEYESAQIRLYILDFKKFRWILFCNECVWGHPLGDRGSEGFMEFNRFLTTVVICFKTSSIFFSTSLFEKRMTLIFSSFRFSVLCLSCSLLFK